VNDRQVVLDRAADAYRALWDLAETVEDEWQYINDLGEAYLPGIVALGISSGAAGELGDAQVAAVDEAIAEIALIADPHKAIDWLSTFPHVVALAVSGDVSATGDGRGEATESGPGRDPDDDSPFGMLRGPR
jgi:hypothetical protein